MCLETETQIGNSILGHVHNKRRRNCLVRLKKIVSKDNKPSPVWIFNGKRGRGKSCWISWAHSLKCVIVSKRHLLLKIFVPYQIHTYVHTSFFLSGMQWQQLSKWWILKYKFRVSLDDNDIWLFRIWQYVQSPWRWLVVANKRHQPSLFFYEN